jgi:signal transduction histidine kinase
MAVAAARHTILVVDDEPDVVKSVKDLLRLDYKVLGATSATEGLRILQKEEVHIVMTDQRMPEMTGVEFLGHAKGDAPEAIRLLFTGYADIKAVIDAINQGSVYRYISKPWDPDELQSIIREAAQRFELLSERKNLLIKLQEQNADLERANAELKRANDLKYAFIQVASHELRTPLTILIGLTRLSATLPDVKDPLRDWLGRIDGAAKRLQHLVDQLVTILMAGKFDVSAIERRSTDLPALLNQTADDVRPFTELRGQRLVIDYPADLGSMELEADKVRDGVNHLLLNAIKFTPDGGTITLSASRTPDQGAEIRITDTGCGIDTDCKARLFEPFFTGFDVSHHSSGTFEHGRKGLGLGLSVVKAFVEMHGGHIDVQSTEGRGTTFTIKLPPHGQAQLPGAAPTADAGNAATTGAPSEPPPAVTSSARP